MTARWVDREQYGLYQSRNTTETFAEQMRRHDIKARYNRAVVHPKASKIRKWASDRVEYNRMRLSSWVGSVITGVALAGVSEIGKE